MVAHEAEGEGILFGGLIALHEATAPAQHVGTDSLWVLHTGLPGSSGCAWTSPAHVGSAPCARIGHCAALREQGGGGATVYVYGGFVPDLVLAPYEDISEPGARPQLVGCKPPNAGAFLNDLVILTLPGWEWSRPNVSVDHCSPPACISATLTSLGRHSPHLLLFGGVAHGKPTQQALLLDAEALIMRELRVPESVRGSPAHAAASRCNHTATLVQGRTLVIYGGATGEWEHDGAIMLDTNSLEWGVLEARGAVIPLPRQRHAAVAVRDGLLVLGGSCGDRLLGEVHLLRVPAITVPLSALCPPQTPTPPSDAELERPWKRAWRGVHGAGTLQQAHRTTASAPVTCVHGRHFVQATASAPARAPADACAASGAQHGIDRCGRPLAAAAGTAEGPSATRGPPVTIGPRPVVTSAHPSATASSALVADVEFVRWELQRRRLLREWVQRPWA
jgi:hypothetical protein